MKTITHILTWTTLNLLTSFTSCNLFPSESKPKTELEKLPPITHNGANTFGFLLNGKAIVFESPLNYVAMDQGGFFLIQGGGLRVYANDPLVVNKVYDLTDTLNQKAEYKAFHGSNPQTLCIYTASNTFKGHLVFGHFDSVSYTISGTFEFSTVTQGCDTIRITDGRFDVHYIP